MFLCFSWEGEGGVMLHAWKLLLPYCTYHEESHKGPVLFAFDWGLLPAIRTDRVVGAVDFCCSCCSCSLVFFSVVLGWLGVFPFLLGIFF